MASLICVRRVAAAAHLAARARLSMITAERTGKNSAIGLITLNRPKGTKSVAWRRRPPPG
jgi:hypothetical protein